MALSRLVDQAVVVVAVAMVLGLAGGRTEASLIVSGHYTGTVTDGMVFAAYRNYPADVSFSDIPFDLDISFDRDDPRHTMTFIASTRVDLRETYGFQQLLLAFRKPGIWGSTFDNIPFYTPVGIVGDEVTFDLINNNGGTVLLFTGRGRILADGRLDPEDFVGNIFWGEFEGYFRGTIAVSPQVPVPSQAPVSSPEPPSGVLVGIGVMVVGVAGRWRKRVA
jgi:hypothetical protein